MRLFEEVVKFPPSGKVHYVMTNAGIVTTDKVFAFDGVETGPRKPSLKTIEINLCGVTSYALFYPTARNSAVF